MAATIGAKIEVQGEQQYTSSIKKINQETKELKSEMELLTSSFDKNTTAEEKAAAKSEVLSRQIDVQQQKVDLLTRKYDSEQEELARLKAEMEKATQEYGANSKEAAKAETEYNKFASATSKTKTELNNAQASLNKMKTELEQTQNPTKEEAEAVGDVDENLKNAGKSGVDFGTILKANVASAAIVSGVRALAKAVKDVASGIASSIGDTLQWADDLNTLSIKTGLSTDKLQEFEYMADLIDTDVETIAGSMTKLIRSMNQAADGTGSAAEAYAALGITLTDSNGELRAAEEVFGEVIDALGAMENETQRDAYAMEIFGKSARELNPLIEAGSDTLADYAREAHEVGYVLDNDTIAPLTAAKDAMDRMKKAAESAKRQLIAALGPRLASALEKAVPAIQDMGEILVDVLEPAIESISGLIEKARNILAGLSSEQKTQIVNIGLVVAALSPFLKALGAMLPLLMSIGQSLSGLIGGPVVGGIMALVAGVTALGVAANLAAEATAAQRRAMAEQATELTEAENAIFAAADAATSALQAGRQAADEAAEAMLFSRDRAASLADELFNLADANGFVAEGDQAHAETIINELNEAFGLEIELVDGQIQGYQDLKTSIYETIDAKTAEALLDRNRDAYIDALQAEVAQQQAVAQATELVSEAQTELAAAEAEAERAAAAADAAQQAYTDAINEAALAAGMSADEYTVAYAAMETAMDAELREARDNAREQAEIASAQVEAWRSALEERQGDLDTYSANYADTMATITRYGAAQVAAEQGNTQRVIDIMTGREQVWVEYEDVVDTATQASLDAMYEEVTAAAQHAAEVRRNWENGVEGYTKAMVDEAEASYEEVRDAFSNAYDDAVGIGSDYMDGLDAGLKAKRDALIGTANAIANAIPHGMRDVLGIASPSKVAAQIGKFFDEGLIKGLDSYTSDITATAEEQAAALVGAYDGMAAVVSNGNGGVMAGGASNAYNYGGISIVVNGAPGQDEEELADIVMERINSAVARKEAVFA